MMFYGLVSGVGIGAFRLGESVEEATALGIAVFIQITVGVWLGLKITIFLLHIFQNRLHLLVNRMQALESRSRTEYGTSEYRESGWVAARAWVAIVMVCICITLLGTLVFTMGAVSAVFDFRVDIHPPVVYLVKLAAGGGIALLGLVGSYVYLWGVWRTVTRWERQLDLVASADGLALNTQQCDKAISNLDSLVYKATGQRLAA